MLVRKVELDLGNPAGGPLRQNQLAGMNQVACDSMLG